MTESEWLGCTDPQEMLAFLRDSGNLSERKARLFAVACCRRIWHLLTDGRSRKGVEVAERYADGLVADEDVGVAGDNAYRASEAPQARRRAARKYAAWAVSAAAQAPTTPFEVADEATFHAVDAVAANGGTRGRERNSHVELLRCLFGNSFHPPPLDPAVLAWQDATLVRLATAAYEERELPSGHLNGHRLAVLADAVEEAGGDAELVEHLRGPGPHVRGCWVVDLLLGKK